MKTKRSNRLLAAAIFALAAGTSAYATTLTWDTAPGTIGAGDSAITGGNGAWDESAGNWTADGGANNIAWVNANNDSAIFGGSAGSVTLSSVTANGLTFNDNAGYTLGGGTLTLAGATPTITTNVDATISSVISGGAGLIKAGTGMLTVLGANNYTGGTTINDGIFQIGDGTTNGTVNGTYSIASGGVLKLNYNASGATAPNWADITGAGTLTLETAKNFDYGWGQGALGGGFTGILQIDGGRVYTTGSGNQGLGGTTAVVVTPGGHLGMWEGGTFPQNFTIAGTGYGESGYESALRMGNGGKTSIITGIVALSDSATIGAGGGTGVLTGVISGGSGAALTIGTSAQGGNIIFSAANTYAGTTTINNGYLYIGYNGGTTGTLGSGNVVNNAGLIFNRSNAYTVTNTITGGGTIYGRSGGTVTLGGTGANTCSLDLMFAGNTTVILAKTPGVNAVAGSINIGNNYYGSTGYLLLGASEQIADTSVVTLQGFHHTAGGQFSLMGNSETIGGLASSLGYNSGAVIVQNGGAANSTLTLDVTSGTQTFGSHWGWGTGSQIIRDGSSGSLAVVKNGAGTQIIGASAVNSSVTYTGGTTINGGVLEFGGNANIGRGTVTINDTGTFRLAATDASDSLGLITINAGGVMTASANWQWITGGLRMNGGEMAASVAGDYNYGNYLFDTRGVFEIRGTQKSTISADVRFYNVNRTIDVAPTGDPSGTDLLVTGAFRHIHGIYWGFMTKIGDGTMELTSTNNSIGSITVNAGKVIFKDQMSGLDNGGLINNASVDANISTPVTFANPISGIGTFTKLGSDTLTLSGTNTCTGATTINAGTLALSNGAAIANTGAVTLADAAGATLLLNNSETIGSLNGGGATGGNVTLGSNTLTTGDANTNASYAGVISGTGGFTKSGGFTQTLSGANDYTGATTVSGGTLNVTGSLTSAVTVASGAVLSGLGGSTTSTLTLDAGSTIQAVAQSAGAGTAFRAAGAVTTAGTVTIAGTDGTLDPGTHNMDVLGYGTTPGTANFSTANFRAPVLVDDTANSKITLAYETALRTWNLASGTWDNMITAAWQEDDQLFAQNDKVVFDDSGLGGGTTIDVALNSLVLPVDVKFDNDSSDFVISGTGAIGGPTSITKTLAGTVFLSTANTYTGGTTVSAGTLQANVGTDAGAKTMFGTGMVSVSNAALKIFAGSTGNAMSFANNLALDNANFTSEDAVITYSGTISLTNTNSVNVRWGNKNAIFANAVSGTGGITKTGDGDLIFTGTNDYSGTTTVSAGTLRIGDYGPTGTLGSGDVVNNATLAFSRSTDSTAANTITGTGNISMRTGNVTLSGPVTCNNINFVGGYSRTLTLSGSLPNVTTSFTSNQDGHGTLVLAKDAGVNALSGTICVGCGGGGDGYASQVAVRLGNDNQIDDASVVRMGGSWGGHGGRAWFQLMGYSETIAGLIDGTSQSYVQNGALTPTTLTLAGSGTYSVGGSVHDGGTGRLHISKTGGGTQTFSGNGIDYNGSTTVTGGRLIFSNNDDTWTTMTTVGTGATVEVYRDNGDSYEHRNAFTLNGAGTFEKTGNGTIDLSWDQGGTVAMASGGLIHIKDGTLRLGYGSMSVWTTNMADLTVDAAATFDLWDNNNAGVFVDSLNGGGSIIRSTYGQTGYLTVGVDNGSGDFSGVISCASGNTRVTKTGSGTQILSGSSDNTSITVAVTGGTLVLAKDGAGQRATAGVADIGTGATLQLAGSNDDQIFGGSSVDPFSRVAMTGGTLDFNGRNESWDRLSGTGTVTNSAAATTSIMMLGEAGGSSTFDGVIADGAGTMALTKIGTGTLSLTGTNTYTGDTTVSDGILEVDGTAIADTGTLVIDGGQVAPIGTEVVAVLDFGAGPVANGTYGATGSGAPIIDDTHFSGTAGVVQVGSGTTYASWIASKGLAGDDALPGADPDNDGVPNSVEMVLGGNPKTGMDTALLPTIELVTEAGIVPAIPADNYLLFTYRRADQAVDALLGIEAEYDADLVPAWTVAVDVDGLANDTAGVQILVDNNWTGWTPAATVDTDRVRVFVPLGSNTELFGRLNVVVP